MKFSKNKYFLVKSLTVLILFVTLAGFIVPHRFYLSLTEIHIDSKKQTMDISCKLFTDDLQDALFKKYGKKIDIASSAKNKDVEALLEKYINENFRITIGGKSEKLSFVGFETETDATWCYLEKVPFKDKGKVSIMNTLLYDYLPEQSNMVNFYWDDLDKSGKVTNPEKTIELEF
jgi:hypothetical protein